MNIQDLNNKLDQLAQSQSRENVIEFAYTLLDWIGIEPTTNKTPQLLAPKTQKLKDYLLPAPQTVQPQLYRLNAENQNIRVRFAVLKKIKKDYISQLVDNDPGAESFQNTPEAIKVITKAPYFVHFVTTPDFNKLVLIFNNGEQKRILNFRNRLTNTQYNKIIQQWSGVASKSKAEITDIFWKSLDIKEVNKEFYKQVKERFDALVGIAKAAKVEASENQVKQFAVRLIGRYIFCWFLKEKGIIPLKLICSSTIRKEDNYFQDFLLKLFFNTLNTKIQERPVIIGNSEELENDKLFEKIPYLNGGLFDENDEDRLFSNLKLEDWLIPFVEVLENYDFTVDESTGNYQQVAVDPEMLGRIFENLLASQNEETEKIANQRKAFGAFYTPREIVEYMVNESIKAYLQTSWENYIEQTKTEHINNPKPIGDIFGNKPDVQLKIQTKLYQLKDDEKQKIEKTIAPLFASQPNADGIKKEEKALLDKFLSEIKILDPACGSGAFPMGVLHKLKELRELLGFYTSAYQLKLNILSHNIYGVDIMPMATEIARLRSWLSLVLDSDYKPEARNNNFGIDALPNLDFKFVCANSLIDLGLDAFIQESKGTFREEFTRKLVIQLKELEDLRKQFFLPDVDHSDKVNLKKQYLQRRDKVVKNIEADSEPVLKIIAEKIKNWNPFDDSFTSTFFSPTWMFGIDKGFDVVIGNPPYGVEFNAIDKELLKKKFVHLVQRIPNSYLYFIGLADDYLKVGGVFTYIIPNEFLFQIYMEKARKYFLINKEIKTAINVGEDVFEAIVPSCIILIKNTHVNNYSVLLKDLRATELKDIGKELNSSNFVSIYSSDLINSPNSIFSFNQSKSKLINKLIKISQPFECFCEDVANGISTSCDNVYIVKEKYAIERKFEMKYLKSSIRGSHFNQYFCPSNTGEYLLYITAEFDEKKAPNIFKYLKENKELLIKKSVEKNKGNRPWHVLFRSRSEDLFNSPKIIIRQTGDRIIASIDENNNYYCIDSVNIAKVKELHFDKLKYFIGLLNSTLSKFVYNEISQESGRVLAQVKPLRIRQMPIIVGNNKISKQISLFIDKILSSKNQNKDTTALEKEIDIMVYKLYELTYEEVKIVEPEFALSEEEYEKFEI